MKKINCNFKHIKPLPIINYSGFFPKNGKIEIAKKHSYTIIKDISVTGDAPKDIIRLYEYKNGLKSKYKNWPIHIAKLGHKYYPMESITEQLITDIGLKFGFNLASSKICWVGGQIRFLSLYFLNGKTEELYHGANMYAGFLNNDEKFVDEIELKGMTQDFFTIKFSKQVIEYFFPNESEFLFKSFMRMLLFDGLVGNNDRHMYNWGVIKGIYGIQSPKFAPIYDSARGLLWNERESRINELYKNKGLLNNFIKKYCEKSKPKIGIENEGNVNHFELIQKYSSFFKDDELTNNIFAENKIKYVISMINKEYIQLLSENRRKLVIDILIYRFEKIRNILNLEYERENKKNI